METSGGAPAKSPADVLEEIRGDGHGKVKVADHRHRRHPARQVPPPRTSSSRRSKAASASATSSSAGTRATPATTHVDYTGWHTGYPDAHARLDLATYREVPWDGNVAFFLGDFVDEATARPLPICPRQLLKTRAGARRRARGCGRRLRHGVRVVQLPRDPAVAGATRATCAPSRSRRACSATRCCALGQNRAFINALIDEMAAFGVPIEGLHTETGPGVYEAAHPLRRRARGGRPRRALQDGAKEIGHRFGIMPTFMAKWNAEAARLQRPHPPVPVGPTAGDNLFHDAARSAQDERDLQAATWPASCASCPSSCRCSRRR